MGMTRLNRNGSLGTRIRAARLGWGFSLRHGAFIRMSDADGLNSRIELCPENWREFGTMDEAEIREKSLARRAELAGVNAGGTT